MSRRRRGGFFRGLLDGCISSVWGQGRAGDSRGVSCRLVEEVAVLVPQDNGKQTVAGHPVVPYGSK